MKPLSPKMEAMKKEYEENRSKKGKKKKKSASKKESVPSKTKSARKKNKTAPKKTDKSPKLMPRLYKVEDKDKDHFTPIRHEAIRWSFHKSGELFATYQLLLSHTSEKKEDESPKDKPLRYSVWRNLDGLAALRGITRRTLDKHIHDLVAIDLIERIKRKEFDDRAHGLSPAFLMLPLPDWVIQMYKWRNELAKNNTTKPRTKELKKKLKRLERKITGKLSSRIQNNKHSNHKTDESENK